jgi:hypothetical protein
VGSQPQPEKPGELSEAATNYLTLSLKASFVDLQCKGRKSYSCCRTLEYRFWSNQIGIVRLTGEDAIKLLTLHTALMRTSVSLYHRHRFPAEIISHCVWLNFRFALSFSDIEEMLAMRGVVLSYATIREWSSKLARCMLAI